jgi:hypothetical protein
VDTQTIIQDYVNDVAALLPRGLRNDVGLELRTLLMEQVQAAAKESGRPADRATTLEILRRFGTPAEVAARYRPRGFQIIEPDHAPAFVKLSIFFVVVQWALTLPFVFGSPRSLGEWWLGPGLGALWWVGLLTLWFAAAGWLRRRFPLQSASVDEPAGGIAQWLPSAGQWNPVDREGAARRAAVLLLPLSLALIVFFISPTWFIALLLPGRDTAWAAYAPDFARELLPVLIGLMFLRLLLFAAVLTRAGWWRRSEALRFGLRICFIALLYWAIVDWTIFENGWTNVLFKAWLLIFAVVNTVRTVAWIRRATSRVRAPHIPAGSDKDMERRS